MATQEQESYIGRLCGQITEARLGPYLAACGGDRLEALARYYWNIELSEAFYPVIHSLEVALRNSLDSAVVGVVGRTNSRDIASWLDANPTLLLHPNGLADVERAKGKILRTDSATGQLIRNPKKGHPDLVAALSFGFWTGLLEDHYAEPARKGTLGLWPSQLETVFPGAANETLAGLRGGFNAVRHLRNRVFHHEPLWAKRKGDASHEAQHGQILTCLRWLGREQSEIPQRLFPCREAFDEATAIPKIRERVLAAIDGALALAALKRERREAKEASKLAKKAARSGATIDPDAGALLEADQKP